MFVALIIYFTVGCLLAGLLLPSVRSAISSALNRAVSKTAWVPRPSAQEVSSALGKWRVAAIDRAFRLNCFSRRNAGHIALGTAFLLAPAVTVYILHGVPAPETFVDEVVPTTSQAVVSALFNGEHLTPPAPLPPELFTAPEVEAERPQIGNADRRWNRLDPAFAQLLLRAYKVMREEHGYDMVLLEGYRSPERQEALAAMGTHVTHARAWQSRHQYGLAADSAFLRDGRIVISERDGWAAKGYELYGDVARRLGLTWGGHWQVRDLGHVELRKDRPVTTNVGG